MKRTVYVLPIAGAGFLSIPATQPDRRVEIVEDDSVANQGIIVKFPEDGFTQAFVFAAGHQPVVLGSTVANQNGFGNLFAHPIQKDQSGTVTLRPADILIQATSATANATKIRVTEYS